MGFLTSIWDVERCGGRLSKVWMEGSWKEEKRELDFDPGGLNQ